MCGPSPKLGSRLIDLAQPFLDHRCNPWTLCYGSQPISRSFHARRLLRSRCDSAQGSTWLVLNALVTPTSALAVGGFGEARGWRSRSSSGMAFRGRLVIFLTREICGHEFRAEPMGMSRPGWICRGQSTHFGIFFPTWAILYIHYKCANIWVSNKRIIEHGSLLFLGLESLSRLLCFFGEFHFIFFTIIFIVIIFIFIIIIIIILPLRWEQPHEHLSVAVRSSLAARF